MELGYKSPIEIVMGEMRTQYENEIFRAIQDVNINVDKEELIKALEYDRGQYEKGYNDAINENIKTAQYKNDYCTICSSAIPTDHKHDYISRKEVRFCYYCGAKITEIE